MGPRFNIAEDCVEKKRGLSVPSQGCTFVTVISSSNAISTYLSQGLEVKSWNFVKIKNTLSFNSCTRAF